MFYLSHALFSTISNEKSLSLHHGFPVYNIVLLDCYQEFLFYLRFGFQRCDYNETSYLEFAELLGLVKLSLYPKFERFSGIIVLLFLFFFNNRTILLNIWTYLFCTTRISFFPLPQEASALEPHVYKNTLWQLLCKVKKVQFWKWQHTTKVGNRKGRAEWAQGSSSSSLKRKQLKNRNSWALFKQYCPTLLVASLFQFHLSWCCN